MARDLKKENEWRKQKYKRFVVDVDIDTAKAFIERLHEDNITYSEFVKEKIKKYLKKIIKKY